MSEPSPTMPPIAPTVPHIRRRHGFTDSDGWAWMRDVNDPLFGTLLAAENRYADDVTGANADLTNTLFEEIRGRIRETDLSVPHRKGDWWYQVRTQEGMAYPIHVRIPATAKQTPPDEDAPFEVVLDENAVAEGYDYSQIGGATISPDGKLLAWSVDHTGDESHSLHIRDLTSNTDLDEIIDDVSYPLAWSADGEQLFYVTLGEAQRPDSVWRHRLGTDTRDDVRVFHDPDARFNVDVAMDRSENWILVSSHSAVTSEYHLLDAHEPTAPLRLIAARQPGVELRVEAHRDALFILSNESGAEDFALFRADVHAPERPWEPMIAHERGIRLEDLDAFEGHLVVHRRRDGLTGMSIIDLDSGTQTDLDVPGTIVTVAPSTNAEFSTTRYRFIHESFTTPPSVFEVDLSTGERWLLKTQVVEGGYDPDDFVAERVVAIADDGESVPVSIVRKADTPLDGSAPGLLYGYGAYEISIDPWFSASRLSLLERGWVFAVAHVRGGGELGRHWYEDGKFAHKPNTFTDYIACARYLIDQGYTSAERLVARGASAGGLLVGASLNLAPELFAVAVAEVPFVDPLNTLLDPSLPLTVTEWEEWGDPIDDADAFATIRGYAPYENVRAVAYPAMLVTAGTSDPRVSVHEPAKWVQQLRATTTGDRPIVFKIDLGAGHGGPTGRYDAWREEAFVLAFVLDQVAR